jgi:uncharacterized membrane protein
VTGTREESQSRREGAPDGASAAAGAERDEPEVEAAAAARVVYFSDAVVAIAITLLALALPLPALKNAGNSTDSQVLHALGHNWPSYLAFLISFWAVGSHWVAHRRVFRHVARVNLRMGQLTMVWLLMVILMPFTARLLAGSGGFGVRFTCYVLVLVIASACLVLMNREVVRADLLRPGAPEAARHPDNVVSLTIIVMWTLSIPVAFFSAWAFAFWAAVPSAIRVVRFRLAHESLAATVADALGRARRVIAPAASVRGRPRRGG